MKHYSFITIFVAANILMIFLVIYKMNLFTDQSYQQQKLEKTKDTLIREKEILMQQLYRVKNPTDIKQYATEKLGLKKMSLSQVKKLPHG